MVKQGNALGRVLAQDEVREAMKEADIELILERAREKFPNSKLRIISDDTRRGHTIRSPAR